jgi:hypothetical protein
MRPSDTERDGQALVESLKWEGECVVALATEICGAKGKGREECQRLFAIHGLELLTRYRKAMQRYVPTHWQGLENGTPRNQARNFV